MAEPKQPSLAELLEEMRQWELSPDVSSYSAAISACEKDAEWVMPFELLKELLKRI